MLSYVTFAAKLILNIHDLNNETVAGNVTDIRMMEFVRPDGSRDEAPAVSGRMVKHWHQYAMTKLALEKGLPLCDACRACEPIRPGKIIKGKLEQISIPESEALRGCVICDTHGFLIAKGAKSEEKGAKGISSRRTSRAQFSWLIPVIGTEAPSKQVLHTRVSQQEEIASGEGAAQMLFSKSYASGVYALVAALDAERIGFAETSLLTGDEPYVLEEDERKERINAAIDAFRLLLSGQIGASLSHAVPHMDIVELMVAYHKESPLPFPVSPMYDGYLEKTVGLMPEGTRILYFGDGEPEGTKKFETIDNLFEEIICQLD
ncbi:DevR family CRISPR-associated autoregulator [bacterium]|nr:DevR family CRISPR-associated autoregulator [bacterium]